MCLKNKNNFNNQLLYTDLKILDFNIVSELFKPLNSLVLNSGTYFNVNINNLDSNNYIQLKSPTLKYKAFVFKNINLNIEPDFKSNFKIEEISHPYLNSLYDFTLNSQKNKETGNIQSNWKQRTSDSLYSGSINTNIYFHEDQVNFSILNLNLLLFNKPWKLNENSNGWYNNLSFGMNNFKLKGR